MKPSLPKKPMDPQWFYQTFANFGFLSVAKSLELVDSCTSALVRGTDGHGNPLNSEQVAMLQAIMAGDVALGFGVNLMPEEGSS